jgi:hypothetical protein
MHALFAWSFTCRDIRRTGSDPHPVKIDAQCPEFHSRTWKLSSQGFQHLRGCGPALARRAGFPLQPSGDQRRFKDLKRRRTAAPSRIGWRCWDQCHNPQPCAQTSVLRLAEAPASEERDALPGGQMCRRHQLSAFRDPVRRARSGARDPPNPSPRHCARDPRFAE